MVKQLVVINGKTYERTALAGELKKALEKIADLEELVSGLTTEVGL